MEKATNKMITRTFIRSRDVSYKLVIGGQIGDIQRIHIDGDADPMKIIRKQHNLSKYDAVAIVDIVENSELLAMYISEFEKNAFPVER